MLGCGVVVVLTSVLAGNAALHSGTDALLAGTTKAVAGSRFRQSRHVTVRASASQPALEPGVRWAPQPHRPAYRSLIKRPDPDAVFFAVLSAMSEVSTIRARCVSKRPGCRPNGRPMAVRPLARSGSLAAVKSSTRRGENGEPVCVADLSQVG